MIRIGLLVCVDGAHAHDERLDITKNFRAPSSGYGWSCMRDACAVAEKVVSICVIVDYVLSCLSGVELVKASFFNLSAS